MKTLVSISRAYVEFGPFPLEEIHDFHQRGLLQEIDHLRPDSGGDWEPLATWLPRILEAVKVAPAPAPIPAAAPAAKTAPAKKAAAKKAPAKKTVAKKAAPKKKP
jgi:hypothetical protein